MGWFTPVGWNRSANPFIVRTHLDDDTILRREVTEQYGEEGDMFYVTAEMEANDIARNYRVRGLRAVDGVHYPAHRIEKVEVIKAKWILVEV